MAIEIETGTRSIKTTCPRDCYDACGVLVKVRVRDGRILNVRGDPEHPVSRGKLCAKCTTGYNNEWIDPAVRLTQPLQRTGPKGSGAFAPVSWDEAIATIADAVCRRSSRRVGRRRSSMPTTPAPSPRSPTASRCASSIGWARRRSNPDTICNLAGHVALELRLRHVGRRLRSAHGARRRLHPGLGREPGRRRRRTSSSTGSTRRRASRSSSIRCRHETARAADLHLQPFPGSDAALAFALLHVLRRDGLLDRDFIARTPLGWEELEPLLDGCTPAWGEAVTGVPAAHDRTRRRISMGRGRRCSGWGRGCSGSRPAAT